MNKELIVSLNRHETMAAILEDDQVSEIFIEREQQGGVVGNIYKGCVSKVLPGMQCAFVDVVSSGMPFSTLGTSSVPMSSSSNSNPSTRTMTSPLSPSRWRPHRAAIEELLTAGQENPGSGR